MLNQTMIVNGRGMTIVGVAQKGFSSEMPGQRAGALRADHDEEGDDAGLGRA